MRQPTGFARARELDLRGKNDEAAQAYIEALRDRPDDFATLTAFAVLAMKMGHRSAARTAFGRAVEAHPRNALGHANLGTLLCDEGEHARAREHLEIALRLEPDHRAAHRGLAVLLSRTGEVEAARRHGRTGFEGRADRWPYRGEGRPVSVLLVLAAAGHNAPIETFMDDRVFQKWTLSPEFFDPDAELPPHDLVVNAIGDADACGAALDAASAILSRTSAPVLNPPARVLGTGRAENARRLSAIPGVVTARTVEWPRAALAAPNAADELAQAGLSWPLLLRSPGFHLGAFFEKVDAPADLAAAAARLPGETLLVLQFLDTRGADGKFRKYRVMTIGGRLYPLHLAVSANWMVHYFSADMADQPSHQAEDAAFLRDMEGSLGPRAMGALEQIGGLLGLDYGGIDFGIDAQGDVAVFEANAAMAVMTPPQGEQWAYRGEPVRRVGQAVERMLLKAAGG